MQFDKVISKIEKVQFFCLTVFLFLYYVVTISIINVSEMLLTYYLLSIMTARDLEQSFNLVVTACMVAV